MRRIYINFETSDMYNAYRMWFFIKDKGVKCTMVLFLVAIIIGILMIVLTVLFRKRIQPWVVYLLIVSGILISSFCIMTMLSYAYILVGGDK